ncbi:MAG: amidophosphoribosyltransferase [Candidatus Cloacimonetes bacterium]|nr:amidophosphoribosyltransferase [Candidatus Cloacimonadota bacterium]
MEAGVGEFCGIFAIWNVDHASSLAVLGLNAQQHRGQESAGIVSLHERRLNRRIGMGLVGDVFPNRHSLRDLEGRAAIGHVRYSTHGASDYHNVQPIQVVTKDGELAMAHNGNISNARQLRSELERAGVIFQTTTDSEIILHRMARSQAPLFEERLREGLQGLQGAYSLVFLSAEGLAAARDPFGYRPLAMGELEGRTVFASESCAFDIIGARYLRDVEPGELVVLDEKGLSSHRFAPVGRPAHCIFELVYFSRPDSKIFGENVDKTRRKLGKALAFEHPVPGADITVPVPDSSNTSALGYSRRSDVRFELGLIRNHYVGRTFIAPEQEGRTEKVRLKFNTVEGVLRDRSVVLVDDSIVRGTTMRKLVGMIRAAGAREVHVRITSPPVRHPCYFGMDFPDPEELLATRHTTEDELCRTLGADSLKYLSLEGMLRATEKDPSHFCTACFSGNYPEKVDAPRLGCGSHAQTDPGAQAPDTAERRA